MTSQALVLRSDDECFALAERLKRVNILPAAYRGKPDEIAVAIMYGQELGLSPMTSLQRVVVIDGKPGLDAQGMSAVIRQAGHSLSGWHNADGAEITGTRCDNGDTMTVTFTMEDAKRAQLANKDNWKKYPASMCWARCVSQLGRDLFSDCLLGFSYTGDEIDDFMNMPEPEVTVTVDKPAEAAPVRRTSPVSAVQNPVFVPNGFGVPATGTGTTDDDIAEAVLVDDDNREISEDEADSIAADLADSEAMAVAPDAAVEAVTKAFPGAVVIADERAAFIPTSESDPITPKEATGIKKLLAKLTPPIRATADVNAHVAGLVQHELASLTDLSRTEYETVLQILEGN